MLSCFCIPPRMSWLLPLLYLLTFFDIADAFRLNVLPYPYKGRLTTKMSSQEWSSSDCRTSKIIVRADLEQSYDQYLNDLIQSCSSLSWNRVSQSDSVATNDHQILQVSHSCTHSLSPTVCTDWDGLFTWLIVALRLVRGPITE